MNISTNIRRALKTDRQNRRSYNTSSKGWGKRVKARSGRRLNKALAREGA